MSPHRVELGQEGCPYILIKGQKYRPWNEGFAWIAARIKRSNPSRAATKDRIASR